LICTNLFQISATKMWQSEHLYTYKSVNR